jgi:hypothetical protein
MRRTVLSVFVLLSLACGHTPTGPPSDGVLHVTGVEARIAESFPPQVFIAVRGLLPDPCHSVDAVAQDRQGDIITVLISTRRSGEACPAVVVPVEHTVRLEGPFPPGSYVVRVNGVEAWFRI